MAAHCCLISTIGRNKRQSHVPRVVLGKSAIHSGHQSCIYRASQNLRRYRCRGKRGLWLQIKLFNKLTLKPKDHPGLSRRATMHSQESLRGEERGRTGSTRWGRRNTPTVPRLGSWKGPGAQGGRTEAGAALSSPLCERPNNGRTAPPLPSRAAITNEH